MGDDRQREQKYAEAAAFLGEVLERVELGKATLDSCCAERPHLAEELKELYAACHRLNAAVESPRPAAPPADEQGFSAELLGRLSGRKVGFERYQPRGEIAKGGQGTVVQVWDDDLHRNLAMKVLTGKAAQPPGAPAVTPRALARFLEEAQVTGQLDHPGIVPIHELGLDGAGRVYFTMKLVKGRTLKEVYQLVAAGEEGWNRTRALSVLLKVCEAMAYAHHKGVVHRDLKPANVMVGRFGEVYVMDWGLARVQGKEDRAEVRIAPDVTSELLSERERARSEHGASQLVTMDGHIVGTPAYMSPEQARGQLDDIGPHSDVYSVGAMLYHLLAGHMPYVKPGTNPSNYAIWYSVQERPPERLHERAPDAPAELVAIAEKAMSRDIEARYRDMGELAEDLRAFLEHRVVKAYQSGALVELRKWVERNQGLAAASAAGLLVLIAGLVTALVLKSQSDRHAALAARNADLARANAAESGRNAEEARKQAEAAQSEKDRAEENERRARENERLANERADAVFRLSALQDLDHLKSEADRLWPAHPEMIPRFEQWLRDAQALVDELSGHEAKLAELRAKTASRAEGARSAALARAEQDPISRGDRWWQAQLEKLVDGLYAFSDADRGLFSGVSPEHGWGMRKRLEFAGAIEERSIREARASALWAQAIASIRDPERCPQYAGLELTPQLGLLPIGQDPDSGLWEFAHLQSGEPAERGPDGLLRVEERTGIVLVLLPGGRHWMGSQADNSFARNYDKQSLPGESPVQEVPLAPFFLSKYEMTQGQWLRLVGKNPSLYFPSQKQHQDSAVDLRHPVERISWYDCQQTLARLGLVLPTEAQWEYAARGGTSTVWWTGNDPHSLDGAENLADSSLKGRGGTWDVEEWLDDGYTAHAPVGSYAGNPFGLHDVHGNVAEWCRERDVSYASKARDGDGERPQPSATEEGLPESRMLRGGDYFGLTGQARSAARLSNAPESRLSNCGVRPARSITTP